MKKYISVDMCDSSHLCYHKYSRSIGSYAACRFRVCIASALLSTRKDVSFSCSTYEVKSTIKITSCWLQKKSGNNWVWVCSLTAPSTVAYNTDIYSALMDYSSKIGTATFRTGFTVNADGHAITRYSNSRTF